MEDDAYLAEDIQELIEEIIQGRRIRFIHVSNVEDAVNVLHSCDVSSTVLLILDSFVPRTRQASEQAIDIHTRRSGLLASIDKKDRPDKLRDLRSYDNDIAALLCQNGDAELLSHISEFPTSWRVLFLSACSYHFDQPDLGTRAIRLNKPVHTEEIIDAIKQLIMT